MTTKKWDALWINGSIVSCEPSTNLIEHAAIAIKDGKIAWLDKMNALPGEPTTLADIVYDISGKCLTPGLIDCHTHLVYAGNRAHEFELRLKGVSYEEIAKQGGGIHSTVLATRAASEEELLIESLPRARALLASGVTTMEIKSGYGLDIESELKILRVAKRIGEILPLTVIKTFLGAHTIPKEFRERADEYVDLVCHEMIPKISETKLADAVDVFCEKIAFNIAQTERIFQTAADYGLRVKCHAEQLSDSGSVKLAAEYKALSVDHLEYASEDSIKALAKSGSVAVLLPGAFYYLRETKLPPINLLRQYNIPMAISSDANPGTSPIVSLLIILNMACTLFRLTPEEALVGVTYNAAKALGIESTSGSLAIGKNADFAIWDVKNVAELVYYLGLNPLQQLVKAGREVVIPSPPRRGGEG